MSFIDALPASVRFFLSRRFATFLAFGGLAAVVNLMVGRSLYASASVAALMPFWIAVAIGSASGLLVNFALNYAFNFRYQGRSAMAQLRTFVIVALGGVGLMALIAQALLYLAHWIGLEGGITLAGSHVSAQFVAHVVATGLVTFYSFVAHSALSFNEGLRAFVTRLPAMISFPGKVA